jgi:hypothetical protein
MRVGAWLGGYFVLPLEALALGFFAYQSLLRLVCTRILYPEQACLECRGVIAEDDARQVQVALSRGHRAVSCGRHDRYRRGTRRSEVRERRVADVVERADVPLDACRLERGLELAEVPRYGVRWPGLLRERAWRMRCFCGARHFIARKFVSSSASSKCRARGDGRTQAADRLSLHRPLGHRGSRHKLHGPPSLS